MDQVADVSRWIDAAATPDGGAWLVGESLSGTVLVDMAPDGAHAVEPVPDQPASPHSLAFDPSDGSVWLAADGRVLQRDARKAWHSIPLVEQNQPALLTVIAAGRVLVQQSCASPCGTRVAILDGGVLGPPIELGVQVDHGVADGVGGAWFAIHAPTEGLIHFDGTVRTFRLPVAIEMLAPSPANDGGVLALGADAVLLVGPDGRSRRSASVHSGHQPIAGGFTDGDHVTLVARVDDYTADDPSPILRTVSILGGDPHEARVPVPGWYRRTYKNHTPELRVVAAGGAVWLASAPAVHYRLRDGHWHTLGTADAEHDTPARTRWVVSLSATLGGTWGDRDGFTAYARPEVLWLANRPDAPFGFGPYLELGAVAGRFTMGVGATAALYRGNFAVALSGGESLVATDDGTFAQPVVSVFAGLRPAKGTYDAPLDLPYGVRLDYRPPTRDLPGTFTASASLDMFLPVLLMVARGLH